MLISREDGCITLVNSRTEELFGWPRDLLLGRNLTMLAPDWCHVGRMQGVELRALRRDGKTFPADMTFSPLQTDEGLLITTVVRDITDRKRVEDSIRILNADLERRVTVRTAELTRSNEAMRQFAWAASHDLQEPLRMVLAYSQMLREASVRQRRRRSRTLPALHRYRRATSGYASCRVAAVHPDDRSR